MYLMATVVDSTVRESLSLLTKRIGVFFSSLTSVCSFLVSLKGSPQCLALHIWCFQKLYPWLPSPLTLFLYLFPAEQLFFL